MKPITRKEYYLAKAAGTYTGPTPPPVLREDYYLATLAGDYSGYCPAPVTRLEKYMSAAAGLTTYVPQPVTRIEKYWYAIAKGTGYVPEPVTREEKFLYAVLKNPPKPEYLDKAAQGSLILLTDSAEAPLTALTLYGWSKQDGTPTPENPVPIVSAGDSGEIGVTVLGGNLFNESGTPEVTKDGITVKWLQDEQCFLLNGTATGTGSRSLWDINIPAVKGADYTIGVKYISGNVQVPDGGYAVAYFGTSDELNQSTNWESTDLLNSDSEEVKECNANYITRFWFFITSGVVLNNYKCRVMLNAGSTSLPYEPYKPLQTLILSTPGGLPGIPVSSGGNYTDENGQQWICDEIDLKRGKYVQRVGKVELDGTESWTKLSAVDNGYQLDLSLSDLPTGVNGCGMCNYLTYSNSTSDNTFLVLSSGNLIRFYGEYSTLDEWKAFIAQCQSDGIPLTVYYALATPIETDLPAEEIAAYKALHTYSPTTTVTNDADAWMKVGYKANQ